MSRQAASAKTRSTATGGSRPALSREIVLRAGLAVAGDEGIDAVTIRRIADRLSVSPMALYRHVANKSDLLDGMLDLVVRDAAVTEHVETDWREWTCITYVRMAKAMLEQRGIMGLIGRVGSFGPATLPVIEVIMARLSAAGFSRADTARLQQDLNRYVLGYVAFDEAVGADSSSADYARHTRARLELLPSDEYPALTTHAEALAQMRTSQDLESGLRRIIDSYAATGLSPA